MLVDKSAGWTSHDVVAKVRSILRHQANSPKLVANSQNKLPATSYKLSASGPKVRVGHTGTLDPMATGLLILVIGSYTKKAAEFSKLDKTYEAELTLGSTSTTGDSEGEITPISNLTPSKVEIESAIAEFITTYEQRPPVYSAIKVGGQRAYKLARAGKEVKLESRKVTIYDIQNINYQYPKLSFTAHVSSGTYIRSLAQDIGEKLSTGAYLSSLRRTKVGKFDIKDAVSVDQFLRSSLDGLLILV